MPFSVYALLYCMQHWRDATGDHPRAVTVITGVVIAPTMAVIMSPVMMAVGGAKIATRLVAQEYHRGQESTTRQPRSQEAQATQEAVSAGHPFSTVQSRVGNDGVAKKIA